MTVELKNDLSITGVLKSVDQYAVFGAFRYCNLKRCCRFLNIRLDNIKVADEARHPHMVRNVFSDCSAATDFHTKMAVKNCFIRGSVVRYVQLPAEHVDTQLLEDATRRGTRKHGILALVT